MVVVVGIATSRRLLLLIENVFECTKESSAAPLLAVAAASMQPHPLHMPIKQCPFTCNIDTIPTPRMSQQALDVIAGTPPPPSPFSLPLPPPVPRAPAHGVRCHFKQGQAVACEASYPQRKRVTFDCGGRFRFWLQKAAAREVQVTCDV